MEGLREIEAETARLCAAEKALRAEKLALRDRAREAGLVIDYINNKVFKT